jgi:hypothetical protein
MIKEKVLCLGDNSSADAWAHKLTESLAKENGHIFRGQITDANYKTTDFGYYHTGIVSLNEKEILKLCKKFDKIILLDQPIEKFSHTHIFTSTWKLLKYLKEKQVNVEILNPENMSFLDYWDNILRTNKSFCLYPWIKNVVFGGHYTLCSLSDDHPVTKQEEMTDWKNDKNFVKIRQKMLKGELNKPNCHTCYHQESINADLSVRKHETIEWAALCNLKHINDLEKVQAASYYEVRFSNKCNIKCRMCHGHFSHLIKKETNTIKDPIFLSLQNEEKFTSMGGQEILDYKNLKRVYFGGGEPTIMPEFYKFLDNCIKHKNTNFEIRIGTNAVKISNKLFDLMKNFNQITCSISMDGTPRIDEYIRWGTDAFVKYENIKKLKAQGHGIAINFVCSLYNISKLGEILQYFEKQFPDSSVHFNMATDRNGIMSPFIFPDPLLILQSIKTAKDTKIYYDNEQRTRHLIDGLETHYKNLKEINHEKLEKFFYYNNTLDRVRGSKLIDWIPELAACEKYVKKGQNT